MLINIGMHGLVYLIPAVQKRFYVIGMQTVHEGTGYKILWHELQTQIEFYHYLRILPSELDEIKFQLLLQQFMSLIATSHVCEMNL